MAAFDAVAVSIWRRKPRDGHPPSREFSKSYETTTLMRVPLNADVVVTTRVDLYCSRACLLLPGYHG